MIFSLETGPRFPRHGAGDRGSISSKTPCGNRSPICAAYGWNRASDLLLTSLGPYQLRHIRVASLPIQGHLLHSHPFLPQPGNPKSKPQNPNPKSGFWSLDFGVWILEFGFWILDLGFWILDLGFWIVVVSVLFVAAPNAAVWILDFGFPILDLGFWILGQGLDFA